MEHSVLEKLHPSDVKYCDNREGPYSGMLEDFNENMGEHVMRVVRDDGLYRHLEFRRPGTGMYWFDLITWPGHLAITGDMGDYMFARVPDMFDFFQGYINTHCWAEKLKAGASGGRLEVQKHDETNFLKWVYEDFWESSRDLSHEKTRKWWNALKLWIFDDFVDFDITDRRDCIDALMYLPGSASDHYQDVWEVSWDRYDFNFEYCLASIVTGIRTYKARESHG